MITELAQSLYNVIVGLNMSIEHNLCSYQLQQEYAQLKSHLETYENQPTTLYKEMFDEWCKTDVRNLYDLIEKLINKDNEWSNNACGLLPDIGVVANSLCQIADEIERRRGDIIAEISPKPQPYTSTRATPPTGDTAPEGCTLPMEVDNPQAQTYFTELINYGLMEIKNGRYEWRGTRKELTLCAELMSEKLMYRNKWSVFQALFGVKNLAQERYKAIDLYGKYSNREKKIRDIFEK